MIRIITTVGVTVALLATGFRAGQLCTIQPQPITASSAPQQMASNDVSEFVRMIRDTTERIQPLPVKGGR